MKTCKVQTNSLLWTQNDGNSLTYSLDYPNMMSSVQYRYLDS